MTRTIVTLFVGILIGAVGFFVFQQMEGPEAVAPEAAPVASQPEPLSEPESPPVASKPEPPAEPALPIAMTLAKSPSGTGYVVRLFNKSQKSLAFWAEMQNAAATKKRAVTVGLDPGDRAELNTILGASTFFPGETITLFMVGYATKKIQIP